MGRKMKKIVVRTTAIGIALLAGIAAPLLILAALVNGLWQLYREWQIIRAGLLAGNLTCNLDNDCPPGFVCASGKCVPAATR